jgi:hypothetical protein
MCARRTLASRVDPSRKPPSLYLRGLPTNLIAYGVTKRDFIHRANIRMQMLKLAA